MKKSVKKYYDAILKNAESNDSFEKHKEIAKPITDKVVKSILNKKR